MSRKPIIALDFPTRSEAEIFLKQFKNEHLYVKVGMELFYQEGVSFIKWLKEQGHDIFLDIKCHDIPNTVYRAMKVIAGLDVDMVNVHAAGGREMMKAALKGLEEGTPSGKNRPVLIGVTQLTSTSEEQMQQEQLISGSLKESVLHYATLTYESGLDGVVCSALEASEIVDVTSEHFLRVTPGIRMLGDKVHDQKRVVTPGKARSIGSTMIVIGRSITQAEDPLSAYQKAKKEWELE
ncbi:orotidine-5'-phosphate decarboxylase [Pseudogracilibacillus auburnensis]|uniref:orotidine-5'-phosphate decarboxylase n=1 Tax=Pseudogracilibacillus auburnensis TaxID=1494959 RepID=UPI001A9657A3|nr:orotidine-5'-phosphate decarboxylase [Pseudogracilibacillus auburnensis]MBO1004963.1 orotidine-5'-phosphate decarboxylase [Pseudogracilibacillus auburnensis]